VDTVTAKLELVKRCYALGVPIISCMGAAYKLDPTAFRVADIWDTDMDPLSKVMRKKLRKLKIPHLKVVFSAEPPLESIEDDSISCRFHCICPNKDMRKCTQRHTIPASDAFVPAAAGLIAGGEVVKDLIRRAGTMRITPEEIPGNEAAAKAAEKAAAHLRKYRAIAEAKKKGTWQDDKVIKPLSTAGVTNE
jgi:tRNA A37 threonylcarbamoyladenosine dehydratase